MSRLGEFRRRGSFVSLALGSENDDCGIRAYLRGDACEGECVDGSHKKTSPKSESLNLKPYNPIPTCTPNPAPCLL